MLNARKRRANARDQSRPAHRHGTEYTAPPSRTSARGDTVPIVVASATNGAGNGRNRTARNTPTAQKIHRNRTRNLSR